MIALLVQIPNAHKHTERENMPRYKRGGSFKSSQGQCNEMERYEENSGCIMYLWTRKRGQFECFVKLRLHLMKTPVVSSPFFYENATTAQHLNLCGQFGSVFLLLFTFYKVMQSRVRGV